jgi:hypothetical protein
VLLGDYAEDLPEIHLPQVAVQAFHWQNAAIVSAMAEHQHMLFGLVFIGKGKDGVPTLALADSRKASEAISSQDIHLGCKYGIHDD